MSWFINAFYLTVLQLLIYVRSALCLFPVYPTPLTSVRFRESVFRETGHTIMNLLAVSVETPALSVVNSSEDTLPIK